MFGAASTVTTASVKAVTSPIKVAPDPSASNAITVSPTANMSSASTPSTSIVK